MSELVLPSLDLSRLHDGFILRTSLPRIKITTICMLNTEMGRALVLLFLGIYILETVARTQL